MMEASSKAFPTSTDLLIFPTSSHSFSQTLASLKRSRLSIKNRLSSIHEDSEFVQKVASAQKLPLVTNERCGSWYVPPEKKACSAYFKSTDGHQGQWSFSLRRLNLQVLDILGIYKGCIIVDSTRSGKSMPDALSKTVPIWCAVMNRLLFPARSGSHILCTPPSMVGRSEHSQIEARLDGFLTNVEALQLDLENLRAKVQKPLRPEWITQSSLSLDAQDDADYHRVVCCTASRQEGDIGVGDDGYVQGAGDDSELWSKGLTPAVFWQNRASLLSISHNDEDQIISLVQSPKSNEAPLTSSLVPTAIVTPNGKSTVSIGSIEAARTYKNGDFDVIITCDILLSMPVPGTEQKEQKPVLLQMKCQTSKLGSRTLRDQLPRIKPIIDKAQSSTPDPRILFACASGRDLSVGMGLTVLCLYFDDNGIFMPEATTKSITKDYIRRRLSWIMASKFDANPARATLQSVNAFLMERKPK